MRQALELARRGLYTTHPNPRVGCVLVRAGEVVGSGWHRRAGEAHAEVHALAQAGELARGATAYVTLEPCAHHGRTPPCADALIAAGVARVVVAMEDPFPQVAGAGLARLRAAGIAVDVGVEAAAAAELNAGFISRQTRQRPWIRVKLGVSLDGRCALADGRSQWITSAQARADVQHWRACSSAIVTGIGSVLADDPRLTVRLPDAGEHGTPERIVLDSHFRLPGRSRMLDEPGPILVVTGPVAPDRADLAGRVEQIMVPLHDGALHWSRLVFALAQRGHNELLVEAGPRLAGAVIESGLVDELIWYLAPAFLGHAARPALQMREPAGLDELSRWSWHSIDPVGPDLRLILRPPPAAPTWSWTDPVRAPGC
ncbi:MAG: bifunctional diaminohydroxyphosphoribosylaminopyrimidine deaminase/5-amino-6-(5-phosphoribosylamino)uracil reductase RibD [Lysobacterales bacterium]|nr:bifunctional diaminohydroxyphosphoribosylaminopyrimidine deaminase/5-amino-6-(5-phosphoribosylamino)uracil reductase RibD [Xanthomonadales bacterium]